MFERYLEEINKIDTLDEMDEFIEKLAESEEITNEEYSTLYEIALNKFRA